MGFLKSLFVTRLSGVNELGWLFSCSMLTCVFIVATNITDYVMLVGVLFSHAFVCGIKVACSRAVYGTQS